MSLEVDGESEGRCRLWRESDIQNLCLFLASNVCIYVFLPLIVRSSICAPIRTLLALAIAFSRSIVTYPVVVRRSLGVGQVLNNLETLPRHLQGHFDRIKVLLSTGNNNAKH